MRKVLCLFMLILVPLLAGAEEDAPGRVARLSLLQGEVSLAPAGTDEFADAVLNRPLTSADRLWVDKDARAELQVGSASVHLDQNTGFSFEDLDDSVMRMSLTDGAATIRVRRKLDSETIVVETPNATVALLHPGEYHIDVNEAGDQTVVKARSGEAAVTGEKDSYVVRAAEVGIFKGTGELRADTTALGSRTAFENWANDRDRREENSTSSKYVSRDVVGYEDLDEDGDWISEPEYGYVWAPRGVYAGWAPYRDGRWAWVSPWGWTWVDNARWGFAPFHYGRWAYINHRSRWCWVPGPRHIRPVYAPALVAWVGSPGVSVSVGIGSGVGWFPLGPREVYVPGYWHSRRYIHNVNVTNTVIVDNAYINDAYRGRRDRLDYRYRNRPDAVTVVSRESFAGGRPVADHLATVRERDLRNWRQDSRPPAIAPQPDSVYAGNRTRPSADLNARFARADRDNGAGSRGSSELSQRSTGRVPFDAERRAIEANGGRPVTRSQLSTSNPKERNGVLQNGSFGRAVDLSSATKGAQRQSAGRSSGEPQVERGRVERERGGPSAEFDTRGSDNGSNSSPQWRNGGSRNRDSDGSRAATVPQQSSPVEIAPQAATQSMRERSEQPAARSGFEASRRTRDEESARRQRESAREGAAIAAPASEPRSQRESRPSPRFEQQREARQPERVQAAPAQESTQTQSAPQRAWRGEQDASKSGDDPRAKEGRGIRTRDK